LTHRKVGSLCTNGTHRDPLPKRRKSVTLRSFASFRKRGNFLITRRSGVASDATRREAFAAKGCSRIPPPLPKNEAPGVVRTSGALFFRSSLCIGVFSKPEIQPLDPRNSGRRSARRHGHGHSERERSEALRFTVCPEDLCANPIFASSNGNRGRRRSASGTGDMTPLRQNLPLRSPPRDRYTPPFLGVNGASLKDLRRVVEDPRHSCLRDSMAVVDLITQIIHVRGEMIDSLPAGAHGLVSLCRCCERKQRSGKNCVKRLHARIPPSHFRRSILGRTTPSSQVALRPSGAPAECRLGRSAPHLRARLHGCGAQRWIRPPPPSHWKTALSPCDTPLRVWGLLWGICTNEPYPARTEIGPNSATSLQQ